MMTKTGYIRSLICVPVLGTLFVAVLFYGAEEPGVQAAPDPTTETPVVTRQQPMDVGHPTFVSPHASPIAINGDHVFVVNTPSDTLDVIDSASHAIVARVNVGIDPVSVAVRPDGKEVWVSNHISDSVSVIDNDSASPT